ncbi:hypothetical protein ACY2DA_13325 [Staphylococcus simulans]
MLQRCFEYQFSYFVLVYDQEESDCMVIKDGVLEANVHCQSGKDLENVESRIKSGYF